MLNNEQVEGYNEDGYIIVENVLDEELLSKLRKVTD